MDDQVLYTRISDDQEWKRAKLKKRKKPGISDEELKSFEEKHDVKFPVVLRQMLNNSCELYVLNACTQLTDYKVTFRRSNLKQIDGNTCLRIADCGCFFNTWVNLNEDRVFERLDQSIQGLWYSYRLF